MLKLLIIIVVCAILVVVARRIWQALMLLRVGGVPHGVEVQAVSLQPDLGWQVTRRVDGSTAHVSVEHPSDGVRRTWTVPLRDPGARDALENAMSDAGALAHRLRRTP